MSDPNASAEQASFGFTRVDARAKAGMVRSVFDRVARRYDLMNDLMSLGVHRLWKASLVAEIAPRPDWAMLDVAGGTGDVALRLLAAAADRGRGDGGGRLTLLDINEEMLRVGRDRLIDAGAFGRTACVVGDAERLPLPDASVDLVTIAFGLRNVTRIDQALAEMRRVLRPGGRFYCLEFSRVAVPGLDRIYDAYSFAVLPRLGAVVARDRAAYQYLVESIRTFPDQDGLVERMRAAGFDRPSFRNLSGGIAAIHVGWA